MVAETVLPIGLVEPISCGDGAGKRVKLSIYIQEQNPVVEACCIRRSNISSSTLGAYPFSQNRQGLQVTSLWRHSKHSNTFSWVGLSRSSAPALLPSSSVSSSRHNSRLLLPVGCGIAYLWSEYVLSIPIHLYRC